MAKDERFKVRSYMDGGERIYGVYDSTQPCDHNECGLACVVPYCIHLEAVSEAHKLNTDAGERASRGIKD